MKKSLLAFIVFLFSINSLYAQFPSADKNTLAGGLGLTWIDGSPFYAFRLTPEFSFSKIGVGLDLNLEFNSEGIRKENFNETSDYLSIIRYVRYGNKREKVFVKLGALDYYTLGHGSIMYAYNNSPSIDNRKIGLNVDLDFDTFGFESIYSSFGEAGIMGLRGYTRPLQFTPLSSIPILGNLEFGVSAVGDFHNKAGVTLGRKNFLTNQFEAIIDEKQVGVIGFDIGLPLVNSSMVNLLAYYDFVKIVKFGAGSSAGALLELNGLGILNASVKMERRWNGKEYIPAYFNSFYELERFNYNQQSGAFSSKAAKLQKMTESLNGYFGSLNIGVLNTVNVLGSFQKLDEDPNSGILHIASEVAPDGAPYVARAGYDKVYIKDAKDLFKLDDRSYLFAEVGYKPYPFMIVSMVYSWTYSPLRDNDNNVIGFTPQKKIEPRVSFLYPL